MLEPNISRLQAKGNVKKLIKALKYEKKGGKHTRLEVRKNAAKALGKIGDPQAVEPLSNALIKALNLDVHHQDYSVLFPEVLAKALGQIRDPKAVDALVMALTFRNASVRKAAAASLGEIGENPKSVGALENAINDTDEGVRKAAVNALASIGTNGALQPLIRLLMGNQKDMCTMAKSELDKIAWVPQNETEEAYYLSAHRQWEKLSQLGTKAIRPLVQSLSEQLRGTDEGPIRALIRLGTRATGALIEALDADDALIAANAAYILGEIGDQKAVDPLLNTLGSKKNRAFLYKKEMRLSVLNALHRLDPSAAKDVLLEQVGGELLHPISKARAIEILSHEADSKVVDALVKALSGEIRKNRPYHEVVYAATNALVTIGDLKAADVVLTALFPEKGKTIDYLENHVGVNFSKGLEHLMLDYAPIIRKAVGPLKQLKGWIRGGVQQGRAEASLDFFDAAIEELSKIETQISTNILHKIAKVSDFRVGRLSLTSGILRLQSQRNKARDELSRRGNPAYNLSAFLTRDAWRIKP
jgi:HEAT repeat protein